MSIKILEDNDASEIGLREETILDEIVIAPPQDVAGATERRLQKEAIKIESPPSSHAEREKRFRHLKSYRAALKGDWTEAECIYKGYPEDITARILKGGDTALHIATSEMQINFVKKLVEKMEPEDLATKNYAGDTAFLLAAASGRVEVAKLMMKKNEDLVKIRGRNEKLPIHMAALHGHQEMVNYLYKATADALNDEDRIELLVTMISSGLYDVSLDLLNEHPEIATARDRNGETALHALAQKPLTYYDIENQQGFIESCFKLSTDLSQNRRMPPRALKLAKRLWKQVIALDEFKIGEIIGRPRKLIFDAAEQGNIEFLIMVFNEYPDLILDVDENNYTIFHLAVLNRQSNVFNLIYKIGNSFKDLIVESKDKEGNNILHLAGKLPKHHQHTIVAGAAFQFQRELLWFEEVRNVVLPSDVEAKNEAGKTPSDVFIEKHKKLKEKGEQQLKETANVCMVVATLNATVAFTASLTVPGGVRDDTGMPVFLKDLIFKIFILSDAISLVFSSYSILILLSVYTSRYAEEDFLLLLPKRLIVGLATLFFSMAAMVVMFCSTIFLVFKDGGHSLPIIVALFASLPAIFFGMEQNRFLLEAMYLTIKGGLMSGPRISLRARQ